MAKSLKLIIEALLFTSDKPLSIRDFHSCLPDENTSDIKNALKILEHDYEVLDRSFKLKEVAQGYQFRSRSEYGAYILRLLQTTPNRLSRASMETLAIIAYKQPVLRHEIERLRGVDVGGILRTLMEKGLIKIMGRKNLPGRPLIYGTTKQFLEVFDLKDLSSLPKLKEIKDFGSEEYEPSPADQLTSAGLESFGEANEAEDVREKEDTVSDMEQARGPGGESSEPLSDNELDKEGHETDSERDEPD
ncbi:SMC-Scp complex subunit ScpB [Deltaproteobacteria bacterium]|nr:SMC-Scp complex subunit ScpB [Deltaproteobacteria bacterium]